MKVIYLIDDDEIQNMINQRIIELVDSSIGTEVFSSARNAIERLKAGGEPSLIFVDINMPRMNGWEFLDIYESLGLEFPVFILSSSLYVSDQTKSLHYKSVRGFLEKPLSTETISSVLVE